MRFIKSMEHAYVGVSNLGRSVENLVIQTGQRRWLLAIGPKVTLRPIYPKASEQF